ncbi:MAG: type IV pilus biogenesis protein PilM [Steroidobacteraceae bacterium]
MFSLWKKNSRQSWRAGFFPNQHDTALAIVQHRAGQLPLLHHCDSHPGSGTSPQQVLAMPSQSRVLARAPISGVISSEDYQLLQVEAPEVPATEMRAAVRWKLRDLINFPVDEAVVDVFDTPISPRHGQQKKVYAVAARTESVQRLIDLLKPRSRGFDAIDIPEMCLRNLSALLPQDERGVALLALSDNFAQLLLTRQGTLYLSRRIELNRVNFGIDAPELIDTASLALEIQRSVDYYESHYDLPAISALVIAPNNDEAKTLAIQLQSEISARISLFEAEQHFEISADTKAISNWSSLIALGAALRSKKAHLS